MDEQQSDAPSSSDKRVSAITEPEIIEHANEVEIPISELQLSDCPENAYQPMESDHPNAGQGPRKFAGETSDITSVQEQNYAQIHTEQTLNDVTVKSKRTSRLEELASSQFDADQIVIKTSAGEVHVDSTRNIDMQLNDLPPAPGFYSQQLASGAESKVTQEVSEEPLPGYNSVRIQHQDSSHRLAESQGGFVEQSDSMRDKDHEPSLSFGHSLDEEPPKSKEESNSNSNLLIELKRMDKSVPSIKNRFDRPGSMVPAVPSNLDQIDESSNSQEYSPKKGRHGKSFGKPPLAISRHQLGPNRKPEEPSKTASSGFDLGKTMTSFKTRSNKKISRVSNIDSPDREFDNNTTTHFFHDPDADDVLLLKKPMTKGEMIEQTYTSSFWTVIYYLLSDLQRKQRAFKIGVCTIFLVVSFIVMLKAAVDVSPIAFLKLAQDSGGNFDFTMVSDYSDRCINGDVNYYNVDPWRFSGRLETNDGDGQPNFFDLVNGAVFADNVDHLEVLGFSLLNFNVFEEKLKPLYGKEFKGFTPRWMIPAKIRNPKKPELQTSTLLVIADTQREVELGMMPAFSQQIMSKNDVMASANQLSFLELSAQHKDEIEVYFDVAAVVEQLNRNRAATASENDEPEPEGETLPGQVAELFRTIIPDINEVADVLRDQFNLTVTADNEIEVDLKQAVTPSVNLSAVELGLPPLTELDQTVERLEQLLTSIFNVSITEFQLNATLPDLGPLGENVTINDLIEGNVAFNLGEVLETRLADDLTTVRLPLEPLLNEIVDSTLNVELLLAHNFTILEEFDAPGGKFPTTLGDAVLIDCKSAQNLIMNSYTRVYDNAVSAQPFFAFATQFDETFRTVLNNIDFCKYSMQINGQVLDQPETYVNNLLVVDEQLGKASNAITDALSLNANVSMSRPLYNQLDAVRTIVVFLDSTMITCTAFLALLSMQLIYSLMLSDVEDRTYELGMLRALGFNTNNVLVTVLVQSLIFAVPGVITGFCAAAIMNAGVRFFLFNLVENTLNYHLSKGSIIVGLCVGILIPIASNVLPIKQALGKNLRHSLDMNRRQKGEVEVEFQKLEDLGLSVEQLVVAVMLIVLGIACYYIAPISYLFKNYRAFTLILQFLLLLSVIGMTLLSTLLQPYVEEAIAFVMLRVVFLRDKILHHLLVKNLRAHRARNIKTAAMFAVAMSFLIFCGASFKLLGDMIIYQAEGYFATDLYVQCIDPWWNMPAKLHEAQISEFLDRERERDGAILEYSFVSFPMSVIHNQISPYVYPWNQARIWDLSGNNIIGSSNQNLYGVQRNFMKATYSNHYYPTEVHQDYIDAFYAQGLEPPMLDGADGRTVDPVEMLYSDAGLDDPWVSMNAHGALGYANSTDAEEFEDERQIIKLIVPEGIREVISVDTTNPVMFSSDGRALMKYKAQIRAMVTKMPAFLMSSYRSVALRTAVVTSEEQFAYIMQNHLAPYDGVEAWDALNDEYEWSNKVPKKYLFVKLADGIGQHRRDFIANGIRSTFSSDLIVLFDIQQQLDIVAAAMNLFQLFVGVIGFISLVISFFLLIVSTTSNIRENIWEYGCLRAVGLSAAQGTRLYLYEQYSVILSALLLGSACGIILASIVTAQFYLFLEIPWSLSIPQTLVWLMIFLALTTTGYAVYTPVMAVNKQKISSTIKGTVFD